MTTTDSNRPDAIREFDSWLERFRSATTKRQLVAAVLRGMAVCRHFTRGEMAYANKRLQEMNALLTDRSVAEVMTETKHALGAGHLDDEEFERVYVFGCEPSPPPATP